MINTVADLLTEFLAIERQKLDEQDIKHTPTIGAMYEDLTREALDRHIPCTGLTVAPGFARGTNGVLTRELDCVLAVNEGEPVPRTNKRIFPVDDVIAVVQVKKTLYGSQLSEGFENLTSILDCPLGSGRAIGDVVRRSFQQITGRPFPDDPKTLPPLYRHLHGLIVVDAAWPLRILFGYHGYQTETGFRKGLSEHFAKTVGKPGGGPRSLPSFIIGPCASAVKNLAMPWGTPVEGEWWPMLNTTATIKPAYVFLEALWTKLSNLRLVHDGLFGEDLVVESFNQFIEARPVEDKGWEYRYGQLEVEPTQPDQHTREWSPAFVGQEAYTVANMLCNDEAIDLRQDEEHRNEIQKGVAELESHGIAGRDFENPELIRLITKGCACVILPDGRFAVGENSSGRLARWVEKHFSGTPKVILVRRDSE